jgi:hypothetical protein
MLQGNIVELDLTTVIRFTCNISLIEEATHGAIKPILSTETRRNISHTVSFSNPVVVHTQTTRTNVHSCNPEQTRAHMLTHAHSNIVTIYKYIIIKIL